MVSGSPQHARWVTGCRLPLPAVIHSSCTSGVHRGSGTACGERRWPCSVLPGSRERCAARSPPRGGHGDTAPCSHLQAHGHVAQAAPSVRRVQVVVGVRQPHRQPVACAWRGAEGTHHTDLACGAASVLGTCGCLGGHRGWGRGQVLTAVHVDGEGLCGAGAPLEAVLEAVWRVVAVGAVHVPHDAAERRRLQHGEGEASGALRWEFVDGCHGHEHRHTGCVAHGGSAALAPSHNPPRAGHAPLGTWGQCHQLCACGGSITGATGEEHFLCCLLFAVSRRALPTPL